MEIFENSLEDYRRDENSAITVGSFDGLHLGHRKLIARVVESGSPAAVITFYPHPQTVVARPGKEIRILTLPYEKVDSFQRMGVERLIVLNFNRELMNKSAVDFLSEVLIAKIGFRKIVVGHDHAFGRGRKGSKDFLLVKSQQYGFEVEVVPPYYHKGVIVSSTLIRKTLAAGDVSSVVEMLGCRYSFGGWVVKGEARGAALGYPTANIKVNSPLKLLPLNGVYVVFVEMRKERHPALLYIGYRPTYGLGDLSVEAFLLDFHDDLYGESIKVEFVERLRGDITFASERELVAQIKQDEIRGRAVFDGLEAQGVDNMN